MPNAPSTADAILDHARSLIVLGGYAGFSYADIAQRLGIRKPSIHHHFPAKAELVRILVERYRLQAQEGLAAIERSSDDPLVQLQGYMAYWARCIEDASAPICVCALLAGELPQLPQPVADEVRAHFRDLAAWLSRLLARGEAQGSFRLTGSPPLEAEALMAIVHGAMLSARAYGEPKTFRLIMQRTVDRLATGG